MSELLIATRPASCETLHARAAHMAREVAAVVERIGSTVSGAPETAAFLREWAETIDDRYAFDLQPLDHLADRFGLSPVECDLLVLAGLPEVHEGVAASFRAMNPNDEPWPTAGIAAVVLDDRADRSDSSRHAVRRAARSVTAGPALGKGPRFRAEHATGRGAVGMRLRVTTRGRRCCTGCTSATCLPDCPDGSGPSPRNRRSALWRRTSARTLLVQSHDIDIALGRCAVLARGRVDRYCRCAAGPRRPARDRSAGSARRRTKRRAARCRRTDPTRTARRGLSADNLAGPLVVCMTPGAARFSAQRPVMTVPIGPITLDDRRDAWRSVLPDLVTIRTTSPSNTRSIRR